MLRFLTRLCLTPLILVSLGLLGVATLNLAAAGALLAVEGARYGSTCAMTRAFGAKRPLCEVATGFPDVDAVGTRILREHDPFLVWSVGGVGAGAVLWLGILLLQAVSRPRPRPVRREPGPLRVDFARAEA